MIQMNISLGRLDTLNLLSNKVISEPGEVTWYYSRKQDSKKEIANIYAAIMASINSTVTEAYLHANTTYDQCGIHLVVWLYSTYSMDPDQGKALLMTQIGSLDIMKSKSLLLFLAYIERLGHTG